MFDGKWEWEHRNGFTLEDNSTFVEEANQASPGMASHIHGAALMGHYGRFEPPQ